ncbi:uncharacterized protein LOC133796214 [Humulus lupulus]|uniref:uncharacterized protein LOC133796214 n=1 Tax=Humulus lupulus TaxID=3486 RepID=UPI002B40AAE2|nr:uncharacterized protein LOC133796214 [Humulus lupulus]
MVQGYDRQGAKFACMFKIDLQKAYDTFDWDFVKEMLLTLEFPAKFVTLIMDCVTTSRFSFMINSSLHGYLQSKRGLRQGDPMSTLLCVIGMEYISRIMNKVAKDPTFKFHLRCISLRLTHLCFADDLLLSCKGDYIVATLFLRGFKLFSNTSRLQANVGKSAEYGAALGTLTLDRIVNISSFQRSTLPFKYLGLKICSKRISPADCDYLVDKMTSRIRTWSSRNLSYAGCIILISSVLLTINFYWSQIVILPESVVQKIIQICHAYLWKGNDMFNGPENVSWTDACKPKKDGGFEFKDVALWNLYC